LICSFPKLPTTTQSQRHRLSRLVLAHESRQPAARLTCDVRQKMKQHRQVPWCIEWSAALFVCVAAFSTITHAGSGTLDEAIRDWPFYLMVWAIYGGVAVAVVKAQNWTRWLFASVAILNISIRFLGLAPHLVRSTPEVWDYVEGLFVLAAAVLCFLPPANRHFRKIEPNQPSEPSRL